MTRHLVCSSADLVQDQATRVVIDGTPVAVVLELPLTRLVLYCTLTCQDWRGIACLRPLQSHQMVTRQTMMHFVGPGQLQLAPRALPSAPATPGR